MTQATRYLEEARMETVSADLEAQGYTVERDVLTPDGAALFDLVATRGAERLVIEIKARPLLSEAAPEIRRLRELAQQLGYTGFRLIVVNPPQERLIDIAGFEERLLAHLQAHPPAELVALASQATVTNVSDIDLHAIWVTPQGVEVEGSGVVDVELRYDAANGQGAHSLPADVPLSFALTLGTTLDIIDAQMLVVDTSAFAGA